MRQTMQETMRAVALDRFGGPETMRLRLLPVPEVEPDEILIRVEAAGIGELSANVPVRGVRYTEAMMKTINR